MYASRKINRHIAYVIGSVEKYTTTPIFAKHLIIYSWPRALYFTNILTWSVEDYNIVLL